MPTFKNKDGSLTSYALSCGYIQRFERKEVQLDLTMDHQHYHVKAYDFLNHNRIAWEVFTSLTEARTFWRCLKRTIKKGA